MKPITYTSLTPVEKLAVDARLATRKKIYLNTIRKRKPLPQSRILLVGDRPGPAAPKDPDYHHTPFHSVKHCSGWLNAYLELHGVPEIALVWLNAYDTHGRPTDYSIVERLDPQWTIALGGKAVDWLEQNEVDGYLYQHHPQYWKRFKSRASYPLIGLLEEFTT